MQVAMQLGMQRRIERGMQLSMRRSVGREIQPDVRLEVKRRVQVEAEVGFAPVETVEVDVEKERTAQLPAHAKMQLTIVVPELLLKLPLVLRATQ